jgi:predicted ATPase
MRFRYVTYWPKERARLRSSLAIWRLQEFATMLLEHSARHALTIFQEWARIFASTLLIARRDVVSGIELLRTALEELRGTGVVMRFTSFLGVLAEALGRAGQTAEGLAAIAEALSWTERTEERWVIAELLRIKGELLLLQGEPGAGAAAEDHLRQALDWASRQGALSRELRAATGLARLLSHQGRFVEATALLRPVYDRFTEGFDTADLKAAKALLGLLAEPAAWRARVS